MVDPPIVPLISVSDIDCPERLAVFNGRQAGDLDTVGSDGFPGDEIRRDVGRLVLRQLGIGLSQGERRQRRHSRIPDVFDSDVPSGENAYPWLL